MNPSDSPHAHLDDPDDLMLLLGDAPWGHVIIGTKTVLLICPLCSAAVASASYPDDYTAKEHHIDHHVNIAYLLQRLKNQNQ